MPEVADMLTVLPSAMSILALGPLQFEEIGIGHVLRGGVGGERIGPRIAGETGKPRLLHRDLGALDHELAEFARQLKFSDRPA